MGIRSIHCSGDFRFELLCACGSKYGLVVVYRKLIHACERRV